MTITRFGGETSRTRTKFSTEITIILNKLPESDVCPYGMMAQSRNYGPGSTYVLGLYGLVVGKWGQRSLRFLVITKRWKFHKVDEKRMLSTHIHYPTYEGLHENGNGYALQLSFACSLGGFGID